MNKNIYFDRINVWKETQELTPNYPEPPQSIKFTYKPDYKLPITLKQTRLAIRLWN
jgi:hypothetical protein